MNPVILIEEIKKVEAVVTPIPIDKDANIRVLLEEWSKRHPVIRDVIDGKTTVMEYLTPFAEDLSGLSLFKRLKLNHKHDLRVLNFTDEALSVKGYEGGSSGRGGGHYVSITEGPDGLPYVGGTFWFLMTIALLVLSLGFFSEPARGWPAGMFCFALSCFCGLATYSTWFYGPFEFTRELVPVLKDRAEYLDEIIRRSYPR